MKIKKSTMTLTLLSCLLIAGVAPAQAGNTLKVIFNQNTEQNISIGSIRKITFPQGNTQFNYIDGTNESFENDQVRKFIFSTVSGISDIQDTDKTLIVYSDPASGHIIIKNLPETIYSAVIYRLDGTAIQQPELSAGTGSVDVSMLPAGIYLIRINRLTAKFIKL